jgi:hypothetical protein
MIHTNLRDLFLYQEVKPDLDGEEGTLRPSTSMVLLEKDENAVAYLIGAEGETVEMRKAGNQVPLPLAFYGGAADHLESAIQDRLAALLGAYDPEGGETPEKPDNGRVEVRIDEVFKNFKERFGVRALRVVVANDTLAKLLHPIAPPDVKVYNVKTAFAADNIVLGLTDPKYVGLIVTDPRPRPDDPMNDAPGNPEGTRFPATCHTGMIIHGGIISATARV